MGIKELYSHAVCPDNRPGKSVPVLPAFKRTKSTLVTRLNAIHPHIPVESTPRPKTGTVLPAFKRTKSTLVHDSRKMAKIYQTMPGVQRHNSVTVHDSRKIAPQYQTTDEETSNGGTESWSSNGSSTGSEFDNNVMLDSWQEYKCTQCFSFIRYDPGCVDDITFVKVMHDGVCGILQQRVVPAGYTYEGKMLSLEDFPYTYIVPPNENHKSHADFMSIAMLKKMTCKYPKNSSGEFSLDNVTKFCARFPATTRENSEKSKELLRELGAEEDELLW